MDTTAQGLPSLATAVDLYLEYQRTHHRTGTYRTVRSVMTRYLGATGAHGWALSDGVGLDLVRRYVARRTQDKGRRGEKISAATVAVDVRTLRAFVHWCVREDYLEEDTLERLEAPRTTGRREPPFLEVEEVLAIMSRLEEPWKSMVEVAVLTGMRKGEIYRLRWEDIDTTRQRIRVTGEEAKTWEERWIPVDHRVLDALPERDGSPMVWPGRGGRPRSTRTNRVNEVIQRAAREAGIHRRVTLHWLRHTFASHLVVQGAPIDAVQRLLGHASRSTTEIYTHLREDHLRDAMARFPMGDVRPATPPIPHHHDDNRTITGFSGPAAQKKSPPEGEKNEFFAC